VLVAVVASCVLSVSSAQAFVWEPTGPVTVPWSTQIKNMVLGSPIPVGPNQGTLFSPATYERPYYTRLLTGGGVIPKLWTALGPISWILTGADIGWKIGGSNANIRMWAHLLGNCPGAGCSATVGSSTSALKWAPVSDLAANCGFATAHVPGFLIRDTGSSGGCTIYTNQGTDGAKANYLAAHAAGGTEIQVDTLNGLPRYIKYATEAQMEGLLPVASFVPATTQPVQVQSGFPQPGGCGDTSNACPIGTGPDPDPTLTGPNTAKGDPFPVCNDGGTSCWLDDPDGTKSATGTLNHINCSVDVSYACPAGDPGSGGGWKPGGAKLDFPLPTCAGSVAACEDAIAAAFDGANVTVPSFTVVTLSTQGAVMTFVAGAIVSTNPAGGATISSTSPPTTVTITRNPDPLPLVIPAPNPWEGGQAYCDRVHVITPDVTCTLVHVPDPQGDPAKGPDEVHHVSPAPGGRVAPDPVTPPVITVYTNPTDWPYPPGDPNDPSGPQSVPTPTGSCNGYLTATVDLTPLNGHGLGTKFPFGIFGWLSTALGGWTHSDTAPAFDLPVPYPGADSLHVDLAVLDPAMPSIRGAILIMGTLLIFWSAASALIGLGGRGGDE
jgi:hypothetical protein